MAAQQIKAYVDVQSLAQLTQFKGVSGEQVVRAYQLTHRLREKIFNLLSALAGQRGPYIISGPRGSGKSHLMTLIRALTMSPGLSNALRDPGIVSAAGKLADEKFFVIELDLVEDTPPDMLSLLRDELASREYDPLIFSDSEWEASMSGERVFKLIRSKLPHGAVMALFIDNLSPVMRFSKKVRTQLLTWLNFAAGRFREQNQSLIITLDDDVLESAKEQLRGFKVERIDITNLRDIADRFIFKKNENQRHELFALYNDLLRLMPQFCWSRDDFSALFPIHPAVLEVTPGLRTFSRSFTFFGFANGAASRAMNRRAMNLSSLDELFDSFEFDLRKNENLAGAFTAYDQIFGQGIPKLSGFDEKLWAKLALKALFIFSLGGKAVTLNKLADSVMLYDDRDLSAAHRRMSVIADCFAQTVPQAIEVLGEGRNRTYRFLIQNAPSAQQLLEDAAGEVANDDISLAELLVTLGGQYFADWPLKIDQHPIRAQINLPWRGTLRAGVLKLGASSELVPINSANHQPEQIVKVGFDLANTGEEEILPTIDVMVERNDNDAIEDVTAEIVATADTDDADAIELDWQISLIPINSQPPSEPPEFLPPTLFYWLPAHPTDEELIIIKQALVLRIDGETLAQEGLDLAAWTEKLGPKLQAIFRRLYIDGGRLRNPGSERLIFIDTPTPSGNLLNELLPQLLADAFTNRFPDHPSFGAQLTEYEVMRLAVGLFGGVNASAATVQSYAELYGLPLRLVSNNNGEYRLDLDSNPLHPAVAELLKLVTETEPDTSVPITEVYQKLRREPYGLQQPTQHLITLALVASWRVELLDDSGSRSFGAPQLSSESELKIYTKLRVPATINYTPKLLCDWYALLTAQEGEFDLVSPQGRRQMRDGLIAWRQNWQALGLMARLEHLPADVITTRLWQIVMTCRRYFDTVSKLVEKMVSEDEPLEISLSRMVDTFGNKEAVYAKAVNELTVLINFLDWLPFYQETKNYILAAERTTDSQIEAERAELIGFLSQSQRLLDDEKRQRFETVYRSFQAHYIDFYCTLHDNIMGLQTAINSLDELLGSQRWRVFELLLQLSVANQRYYQVALELIRTIRESACQLPTRELLRHHPFCGCSFRLNRTVDPAISIEILKEVIEQGTKYHQQLLGQYRGQLKSLSESQDEQESKNLETLFSTISNGEIHQITLSKVEALNAAFAKARAPIGLLPVAQLGGRVNKQELKERLERWLDTLPDEPEISLEFLDNLGITDE